MRPVFDFFFSWRRLAAQPMSSTDPVELTDTYGETEPFGDETLEFRTGSSSMALAILQNPGEYLSTQFHRVAVPPLS